MNFRIPPLWQDGFTLFLSLVVQALPFLLLGVMLSGILAVFVDDRLLARWLPSKRWSQVIAGGALGFFFPVCECGNLPVARRLVIKGIPPGAAIAFLLAAPVFNPVVIIATWLAFQTMPEIVVYRVIFSFGIAVIVGWIFSWQPDPQALLQPAVWQELQHQQSLSSASTTLLKGGTFWLGKSTTASPLLTAEQAYRTALDTSNLTLSFRVRLDQLLETWVRELQELGGVLVIGSAIAAGIQTVLPRSFLLDYGQGLVSSILVMLALAVIVSICSTVDAFFALSFAATFTPGAIIAFLVFGPMVDLKSIGLMTTLFKPKVILYILLLTLPLTLLGSVAFNVFAN